MASVISGVLWGMLSRQGVNDKLALQIALPVGFLLALLFWIWAGLRFSTIPARIIASVPVTATITIFEGGAAITPYQVAPVVTLAQDPRPGAVLA